MGCAIIAFSDLPGAGHRQEAEDHITTCPAPLNLKPRPSNSIGPSVCRRTTTRTNATSVAPGRPTMAWQWRSRMASQPRKLNTTTGRAYPKTAAAARVAKIANQKAGIRIRASASMAEILSLFILHPSDRHGLGSCARWGGSESSLSSCPALSRISTETRMAAACVDGRVKPGQDGSA